MASKSHLLYCLKQAVRAYDKEHTHRKKTALMVNPAIVMEKDANYQKWIDAINEEDGIGTYRG